MLRTSRRAAGFIIAAAMLADLVTSRAIQVDVDHIALIDPVVPNQPDFMAEAEAAPRRTGRHASTSPRMSRQISQQVSPWWSAMDPLSIEVLAQIALEPDLTPADVIVGLAEGIRERVARRLVGANRADRRYRWRSLTRREVVAVAKSHDLGPATASSTPLYKIIRREVLSSDEVFLLQLVMHSSLCHAVIGHVNPDMVRAALGPPTAIDEGYRPLLLAAITLLRDLALTH